ncbi:MAG: hypothetical protein Roseis2KO_06940 [Roseivirga sp.]
MSIINKILVPFNNNRDSLSALEFAASVSAVTGARITALHLADPENYPDKRAFQKDLVRVLDQHLQPKLNEIHKRYPQVTKIDLQTRGLQKPVHDHILDFAAENSIDLIVMKTEGLFHLNDWEAHFTSSNSYKVVLEAECPVFTFTQSMAQTDFQHILVPLDLTDGSLYKVPLAIAFARYFGATLHLLSASEHSDDHPELQNQLDDIEIELQQRGVKVVKARLMKETISGAIDLYIEQQSIDLIMIMNRPGFRWSDLWVSPAAKRLICFSEIPILSIRSQEPQQIGI